MKITEGDMILFLKHIFFFSRGKILDFPAETQKYFY